MLAAVARSPTEVRPSHASLVEWAVGVRNPIGPTSRGGVWQLVEPIRTVESVDRPLRGRLRRRLGEPRGYRWVHDHAPGRHSGPGPSGAHAGSERTAWSVRHDARAG